MTRFGDFVRDDAFDASDLRPRPTPTGSGFLVSMANVLRRAGLNVVEVDGWQTRARKSGGYDPGKPWCVMWHHTASQTTPENDVNYICYGCPDAPVSNLYLDRTGTVWICAAGATNTNGTGGPTTFSRGTVPVDSMNTHAVSIEMANNGVGEQWPQAQIDAAFKCSLALTTALGLEPDDVCTHHDWTPGRKIDPATAGAVQGPWRPASINSSGTWSNLDIRAECRNRYNPMEDDEMQSATLWRPQGYLNVFLVGAGNTMNVSEAVANSLTARGVPTVVEAHDQMLKTCLHQTGLTEADLVPGGG